MQSINQSINCVILAAGRSSNTAPYSNDVPKALFRVFKEPLIERIIKQLKEVNIKDITVVIGYMKEKFLYLEDKYNVRLLVNNLYSKKNNIYSLFVARDALLSSADGTLILDCDCYSKSNPYLNNELINSHQSYLS